MLMQSPAASAAAEIGWKQHQMAIQQPMSPTNRRIHTLSLFMSCRVSIMAALVNCSGKIACQVELEQPQPPGISSFFVAPPLKTFVITEGLVELLLRKEIRMQPRLATWQVMRYLPWTRRLFLVTDKGLDHGEVWLFCCCHAATGKFTAKGKRSTGVLGVSRLMRSSFSVKLVFGVLPAFTFEAYAKASPMSRFTGAAGLPPAAWMFWQIGLICSRE
mmetsp:Transcript_24474/g.70238  ORF Transcript_24474/g.70238 Transcript_24474/m.70238 type:complete len:217 (+) Transcript_24474:550-1200(+)